MAKIFDFLDICEMHEKIIYPLIEEYEPYRRELVINSIPLFFPAILLGVMIGFGFVGEVGKFLAIIIGTILTVLLLLSFSAACPQRKLFTSKLKQECFSDLITAFPEINLWQRNHLCSEIITDEDLNKSGLFRTFTSRRNDDEFQGVYKGVEFSVSETELFFESVGLKRSTVFKGLVLKFDCNKKIAQRTVVMSRQECLGWSKLLILFVLAAILFNVKYANLEYSLVLAFVAVIICYFTLKPNLSKKEQKSNINLEDLNFSKQFKVFSEDEVEARYLLTPTFIEKLAKLEKIMKASSVKCSFYDDKIMIAIISDKDFFEIGNLYTDVREVSTIKNFYDDISIIYELVEYFKLDRKIGL